MWCLLVFCWFRPAHAEPPLLLVLGDSLSAGYGLAVEQGWVALLERRLAEEGYNYRVVNASISGDTSRGALARLSDLLARFRPAVTIVELGGNDGLRGISPAELRANLAAIIARLKNSGSRILLVPIQLPPNYGNAYLEKFAAVYTGLAEEYDVRLSPFMLEDIALRPELMQEDGIHPRAEAQPMVLDNLWPALEALL